MKTGSCEIDGLQNPSPRKPSENQTIDWIDRDNEIWHRGCILQACHSDKMKAEEECLGEGAI
jgi:hypothetical protein